MLRALKRKVAGGSGLCRLSFNVRRSGADERNGKRYRDERVSSEKAREARRSSGVSESGHRQRSSGVSKIRDARRNGGTCHGKRGATAVNVSEENQGTLAFLSFFLGFTKKDTNTHREASETRTIIAILRAFIPEDFSVDSLTVSGFRFSYSFSGTSKGEKLTASA